MLRLTVRSPVGALSLESEKTELVIGRRDGVDLRIEDPASSRNHCILRLEGKRVQLIDLGSQNGVLFGGRRVTEAVLGAGDSFQIGQTVITVDAVPGSGLELEQTDAGTRPVTLAAPVPKNVAPDFAREVKQMLARTPWYITSLLVHVIALVVLDLVPFSVRREWPHPPIQASRADDIPDADTSLDDMPEPEFEKPDDVLDDALDEPEDAGNPPAQATPEDAVDSNDESSPDHIGMNRSLTTPIPPLNTKPKVKQAGKPVDKSNLAREHGAVRDIVEKGNGRGLRNIRGQDGSRIIVVKGDFDKMENVLDLYKIKYTLVDRDQFLRGSYKRAYALFVNCARKPLGRKANRLKTKVQRMVRGQGVWLATSDWSVEPYLTDGWPGHVTKLERPTHRQPDTTITVEPAQMSPLLAGVFGRRAQTRWWLEESSVFFKVSKRATVLIRSPDAKDRYGASAVAFEFRDGRGRVLHLLGHFWQEDGNVAGLVAMHKLILNYLVERFNPG